jgi:hypothetical protein
MKRAIQMFGFGLLAVFATACDESPIEDATSVSNCPEAERRVFFVLAGYKNSSRCVSFDTLRTGPTDSCQVAVWRAHANNRNDEFFSYEGDTTGVEIPCGTRYFFAVLQNDQGGYTYFDGITERSFDQGAGPFATGTYEVINRQSTIVGIGHFEFWE